MHEPSLLLHDAVHRLAIHEDAVLTSQQYPQPSIPECGMLLDQLAELLRPRRVGPPASSSRGRRPMQAGPVDAERLATPSFRDIWSYRSYTSDVFRPNGYGFKASRRISLSRTRFPIFCLSFLICSSFRASSSRGRLRRAFSAPSRNFSRQSSTSATVSSCVRAASATEVSPFKMLTTSATSRLAVHRSMGSIASPAIRHAIDEDDMMNEAVEEHHLVHVLIAELKKFEA